MSPTDFAQSNFTFTKPKGMEECADLKVFKGTDSLETPVIISCWKPSPEERVKLCAGEPVWLTITGEGMPPVSLSANSPFQE